MLSIWLRQLTIRHIGVTDRVVSIEFVSKHSKELQYVVCFSNLDGNINAMPKFDYYPSRAGKAFELLPKEVNELKMEALSILYSIIFNINLL